LSGNSPAQIIHYFVAYIILVDQPLNPHHPVGYVPKFSRKRCPNNVISAIVQ